MGWKRFAWVGCLAPVLGGCNIAHYTAHNLINAELVHLTQTGIQHEIRSDARAAWQEVRCQYPRRMFTEEFRDGFLDGYADYLDRGGSAQPPAVPPLKYTRHKKYFTPEGHALIKDYFLGFKYGVDVAVATGQRQFLTVPVLLREKDTAPPAFNVPPGGAAVPAIPGPGVPNLPPAPPPPVTPLPTPRPLPNPPATSAPVPPDGGKFAPVPPTAGPDRPRPAAPPSAPLPPAEPGDSKFTPKRPLDPDLLPSQNLPTIPAIPGSESEVSVPAIKLPEPPAEVPNLPEGLPTPPIWDDIPVVPPNYNLPPPAPPSFSVPRRK